MHVPSFIRIDEGKILYNSKVTKQYIHKLRFTCRVIFIKMFDLFDFKKICEI